MTHDEYDEILSLGYTKEDINSDDFISVIESLGSVTVNVSDIFAYACPDYEEICEDWDDLVPLIMEYGNDAVITYVALKRNEPPLDSCIPEYYEEIADLIQTAMRKPFGKYPDGEPLYITFCELRDILEPKLTKETH